MKRFNRIAILGISLLVAAGSAFAVSSTSQAPQEQEEYMTIGDLIGRPTGNSTSATPKEEKKKDNCNKSRKGEKKCAKKDRKGEKKSGKKSSKKNKGY